MPAADERYDHGAGVVHTNVRDLIEICHQAFGIEKPERQLAILSRSPHGDGDIGVPEPDLQRLFDRHQILRAQVRSARLNPLDRNGQDVAPHAERVKEMTTLLNAGVLLFPATLPMATNTFVSGK